MVRNHGVSDIEIWRPKPATVKIGGGSPEEETDEKPATPAHETDGDVVIVQFLGNDFNKPIIIGALPHPKATIVARKSDDPIYKWMRQVHGNRVGIEDSGKLSVDFTNQTMGTAILPDGTETPAPLPTLEVTGPAFSATIDPTGIVVDHSGVSLTINAAGVTVALAGRKCTVSGGLPIAGIQMGEDASVQSLVTTAALADIAEVFTEWTPVILAAAAVAGIPAANMPNFPGITASFVQAHGPANVAGVSAASEGKSVKTVQLVGD